MKKQILVTLLAGTFSILADNSFMGAKVGDAVSVTAPRMRLSLRQATIASITSSNIIVTSTSLGRFTIPLNQATVIVNPVAPQSSTGSQKMTATSPPAKASAKVIPQAKMAKIGNQILGKFSNDPGYGKAQEMYSQTMSGIFAGQISVDDLVSEAEQVLKTVGEYGPEREKDAQYEPYIAQLRSFLEQAKIDKKIEF